MIVTIPLIILFNNVFVKKEHSIQISCDNKLKNALKSLYIAREAQRFHFYVANIWWNERWT